jgi:hypothetical protein
MMHVLFLRSHQVNRHKLGGLSRKLVKKKVARRPSARVSKLVSQQTVAEKTNMISEYFIAQVFLAADLCLDRNYVSICLLEASFPYSVLLAIMKMPNADVLIKAAVCRLIRCLYVDREPQLVIKYPRLVKTTLPSSGSQEESESESENDSNEGKDGQNQSGTLSLPASHTFGVLQIIISEFLHHGLDATQCNELSSEMMDTLLVLMQFGFYDSTEQLQDIIAPLVQALDDHFMNRSKDIKNNNIKKKSSIILLQEKVGISTSLFDSKNAASATKTTDFPEAAAADAEARESSHVNVNFRHSRRTLNEAMYISLSNQAKNNGKDAIGDASRKSILASTSMEKKAYVDMDVDTVPIELKILRVLESLPGLVIILLIVIIATIFTTVQILSHQERNESTYIFELSLSTLFFLELTIRSYCYFVVHKELSSFVSQPLNILDIALVMFDIGLISLDSTVLGSTDADGAKNYAKTLK